jgi:hypothetical protein
MADANIIEASGFRIVAEAPVVDYFVLRDKVIALLDREKGPYHPDRRYANLVCYAPDGSLLWRAELPTSGGGDCYYQIDSHDPIVVSSGSSYECTIDENTGRIVRRQFFK